MPTTGNVAMLNGERHTVMQCGTCGVWHTIPEVVYKNCLREGGFWHCPNGHSRGYAKGTEHTELENMRRERDRLKQETARLADEAAAERRRTEEVEKKLASAKRRATAGVCPCCTRTFSNVQRHMKTKHPNVVPLEQKTA